MIGFLTVGTVTVSDETVSSLISTLPKLGSGISRRVYALSETLVLKMDYNTDYAGSCATEVAAYESLQGTEAEEYLARIYAHGSGWLVMERAEYTVQSVRNGDRNGNGLTDDELFGEKTCRETLSGHGISDLHGNNLAVFSSGAIKAIDYAFNSEAESNWHDSECCECSDCKQDIECRHCGNVTTNTAETSVCFRHRCEASHRCKRSINSCHQWCTKHGCGYWKFGNPDKPCSERANRCEDHSPIPKLPNVRGQRRFLNAMASWAQILPNGRTNN